MSRYSNLARRFRIIRTSLEQQAQRLRLPFFTRFDERTGSTVEDDQEAEALSALLGITLKEYVVSDEWDPSDEGTDE